MEEGVEEGSQLTRLHSATQLLPEEERKPSNGVIPHGDVSETNLRHRKAVSSPADSRRPTFSRFAMTESGIHGIYIAGNPKNHIRSTSGLVPAHSDVLRPARLGAGRPYQQVPEL